MDFHVVSGDSLDQGQPHDPQHQHVLLTLAWSSVALQTTHVNMVLGSSTAHEISFSGCSTDHRHQHDGNMGTDINRDHICSRIMDPDIDPTETI